MAVVAVASVAALHTHMPGSVGAEGRPCSPGDSCGRDGGHRRD